MFGYTSSWAKNLENVCFGCLTVTTDVRPINLDDLKSYNNYVKVTSRDTVISMCVLCTHLLRRTNAFVNQCSDARNIIDIFIRQDSKSEQNFTPLRQLYNLTKSAIHIADFEVNFKPIDESFHDNDVFADEEDIPLMMLKTDDYDINVNGKKRTRKKWKKEENEEDMIIKQEYDLDNKKDVCQELNDIKYADVKAERHEAVVKKSKRVLREGFTPRMVQETGEYTVIKLSKEQVLKEMSEKSKTEEYQRSLYKCETCVKGFNFEDVLRTHMEKHENKKGWMECDLCHQFCPSVVSFRGHMKSHTTRYMCKVCGCVRLSRQVLLEHHAASHTSEAVRYTCQHCNFVSSKRTSMQRHVRTRHNRTEKHPCELCGKLLNSLEALRVHTTRHDKSKRVKCDQCDRWFVYPSLLQHHKVSVHLRGDYYCVECDVKFKSRENLSLHFKRNRRHRDVSTFKYECEHCQKKFMFLSSLSSHLSGSHGAKKVCDTTRHRIDVKKHGLSVLPDEINPNAIHES